MKYTREQAKEMMREQGVPMHSVAHRLLSEHHSLNWDIAIEAVVEHCKLLADRQELQNQKDQLAAELTRVCNRNAMLINELGDRGRRFTPEKLKAAIVKAMYEGEK